MRHTYECPVRWADMDMLQHVNNVTYVDYLQEARIDMFMAHPEFAGGEELAEGVVVVRHELHLVAPLVFSSRPVLVDACISWSRAASFTFPHTASHERPPSARRPPESHAPGGGPPPRGLSRRCWLVRARGRRRTEGRGLLAGPAPLSGAPQHAAARPGGFRAGRPRR